MWTQVEELGISPTKLGLTVTCLYCLKNLLSVMYKRWNSQIVETKMQDLVS